MRIATATALGVLLLGCSPDATRPTALAPFSALGAQKCDTEADYHCYEVTAEEIGAEVDAWTLEPVAMNDHGLVVGTYGAREPFATRSWVWRNGITADLGTLGGSTTHVMAVNDRGQVVGSSYDSHEVEHAFLWENGSMRDLGTLGGCCSYATDINDHGEVVGVSFVDDEVLHLFHWKDGVMKDLGLALNGFAFINDHGVIAGWGNIDNSENSRAFRIERGTLSVLDDGGSFHQAQGLSRDGIVTLVSGFDAVLWDGDRDVRTVGFPVATNSRGDVIVGNDIGHHFWDGAALIPVGDRNMFVAALNDRGDFAGARLGTDEVYRAAYWTKDRSIDLSPFGQYSAARLLDNHGRVVGTFARQIEDGEETRAMIWTIKYRGGSAAP